MKTKRNKTVKSRTTRTGSSKASKKTNKKKIIVGSLAVGAAGILGYFGWQYWKKRKASAGGSSLEELLKTGSSSMQANVASSVTTNPTLTNSRKLHTASGNETSSASSDSFPLKKGSKGDKVKLLQQALIAKYGKSILAKYGADGQFGSELLNALKKAGIPATVNESTFNVLTQSIKVDKSTLGTELYKAVASNNYNKALSLLKQMQSTEDYAAANDLFKQNRIGGIRQTIVNGLLNTFSTAAQKEAIKFEFLRMGLQFDGNKWSLSGFDGKPIVTIEPATIWVDAVNGVPVPARMVLGNEVSRKLDYTLFENNGKYFLVYSKSVQYLN